MSKNTFGVQNSGGTAVNSEFSASTHDGPEVRVVVFATDDALFRRFIDEVYSTISDAWTSYGRSMPVTSDELYKYAMTGLWARICRVQPQLHRGYHDTGTSSIRCNGDWQMPAIIAHVLNSVGECEVTLPSFVIKPDWNVAYDNYLLSWDDFRRITRRLAILGNDTDVKLTFVRSLESTPKGNPVIMGLVPVRDHDGKIAEVRSTQKFDGVAAFVYIAMGFFPELWADVSTEDHVWKLPPYYLHAAVVDRVMYDIASRAA